MILRTAARQTHFRTVLADNRAGWVSALSEEDTGKPIGIYLRWLPGPLSSSALRYFTADGGHTFQHASTYWLSNGTLDTRIETPEAKPKTVAALRRLLAAWRVSFTKENNLCAIP